MKNSINIEGKQINIGDIYKNNIPPKVSVIVAVYNVEPWIRRSLDSLVNQTLKEIEIVIVDDGSPDKCPEIIDEYAKKDSRIVVIHQDNQGYGRAIYNGMHRATGEYIGFTDPDDYVDLDFYEKLYLEASNSNADIVKGGAKNLYINGREREIESVYSDVNKIKYHFTHCYWSAIYKHEMIKKHQLYMENRKDMVIGQDILFVLKAVYFANKVGYVSDVYYHYFLRQNSLTFQAHDLKKIKSMILALSLKTDFLNEHFNEIDKNFYIFTYSFDMQYLLIDYIYKKNNSIEGCIALIRAAIELYDKCLYKEELKKYINRNIILMLENKDEIAMFHEYVINYRSKFYTIWKIFNLIPFITVKTKENYKIYDLFGFLPLLKVKTRKSGVYYKLFNVLPLIRKEIQRN